jgi:hypothetical protein
MTMIQNFYNKILQELSNKGFVKHPPYWYFYTRSFTLVVFYWFNRFDHFFLYLENNNLFLRFHYKCIQRVKKPFTFVQFLLLWMDANNIIQHNLLLGYYYEYMNINQVLGDHIDPLSINDNIIRPCPTLTILALFYINHNIMFNIDHIWLSWH